MISTPTTHNQVADVRGERTPRRRWRLYVYLGFAVAAFAAGVQVAQASHFRFGHITWIPRPDIAPNTAEFTFTAAFRRTGYTGTGGDGRPITGDVITETIGATRLDFGDGTATGTLQFQVTAFDDVDNWIVGVALDPTSGLPNVLHTYAGPLGTRFEPAPGTGVVVAESELNDTFGTANPIAIGDDLSGTIDPALELDYVSFAASAGETIIATMVLGTEPNAGLTLYDTDGVTQLTSDFPGTGIDPTLTFTLPAAGTYFLEVIGEFVGTYTLELRSTTAVPTPFLANTDSCCRISGLRNCSFCSYRVETDVRFDIVNSSPVSSLPPIVNVPINTVAGFLVPALDAQGDVLTRRFSTIAESRISDPIGPDGTADATNAPTIDPVTGVVTWDTTGGTAIGDLFTMQVAIEESRGGSVIGKSVVDFLVRIVDAAANDPPTCTLAPAGPFTVAVGDPVTFTVSGTDPNAGDIITLNTAGLPPGATMAPLLPVAGPNTGVSSIFNWTPASDGVFVVTYSVTDGGGLQALCSAQITVRPLGVPKFSQPPVVCACNGDVNNDSGITVSDTLAVASCIGGDCSACVNSCDIDCNGVVDSADGDAITCLFSGLPTDQCCPPGEDIASNIDWVDEHPNVVAADDFISDGRRITGVRWWGSELNDPAEVCGLPVPPGALGEGEPVCANEYNDTFNAGCNVTPPATTSISCGRTVWGTSGNFTNAGSTFRDTDWFEVTVTQDTELTWTVTAEFPAVIGFIEAVPIGSADCADTTGFVNPSAVLTACGTQSVVQCVPPGTYRLFVSTDDFTGTVCGARYMATLSCTNCTFTPASSATDGPVEPSAENGRTFVNRAPNALQRSNVGQESGSLFVSDAETSGPPRRSIDPVVSEQASVRSYRPSNTAVPANVAIFEDVAPWGNTANEDVLVANGIAFTILTSADMGVVDLSPFDKVIIASNQQAPFYNALVANRAWFEAYANAGGILDIHLAAAFSEASVPGAVMPGGFVSSVQNCHDDVTMVDSTHPVLNTPTPITDANLDGWNCSSHGFFSTVPPGATEIIELAGTGEPCAMDLIFGAGRIFATLQPVEWSGAFRPYLENTILHDVGGGFGTPDGWLVSFHEPIFAGALPAPPLGLYFCDAGVVKQEVTPLPSCDGHPLRQYAVDLAQCCLVHENPDSRSGGVPATVNAFQEEQCFTYALDVQAVVGHRFVDDGTGVCVEEPTGRFTDNDIWGWHTTVIERGPISGRLQQAFASTVTMAGPDWLYGPWQRVEPVCSHANMAFELLTDMPVGLPDNNGDGIPDLCESPPVDPPLEEANPVDKNRYISFVPGSPGVQTALRVTMIANANFPTLALLQPQWWVTSPQTICENSGQVAPPPGGCATSGGVLSREFETATLACVSPADFASRACRDWGSLGLIHVTSENITPGALYRVEAIDCALSPANPNNFSTALDIGTPRWADLCGTGPSGACSGPPDGVVDVQDLIGELDKFRNNRFSLLKARTDLSSTDQSANGVDFVISVAETVNYIDAFGGAGYPFAGPVICP